MSDTISTRPIPRPALAKRIAANDLEIYGIVHWGLNTFTDREWGFGNENPEWLNPDKFDADQIVQACVAGGLRGLIVVAKHHDGFCLWPTKTTDHNISKSPFRDGKGNYVREMEQACRKAGIKFGVYISPWDRNNADYANEKYVEKYHAQIRELLGGDYGEVFEMWFDGANGGDGYYGGANEKRKISDGYYRFDEIFRFVRELQPSVCIFNEDDGADFRWPGNEQGFLDNNSRATIRSYDKVNYMQYCNTGDIDGCTFHPCEADFPLRKGWFYHEADNGTARNSAFLMQRYLLTVGNGGTMNIGIAPNKHGLVCDEDIKALSGFKIMKDAFFSKEITSGNEEFNVIVLQEDVSQGEQVDEWEFLADGEKIADGTSVGIKRIRILNKPVKASDCAVKILKSGSNPQPVTFKRYFADPELINAILSATTNSGETDTAKWMTAAAAAANKIR